MESNTNQEPSTVDTNPVPDSNNVPTDIPAAEGSVATESAPAPTEEPKTV